MKNVIKITAITAIALSQITFAKSELTVDEYIKVTAINGKEIHHGILQPLQKTFNLDAGRHIITARYDRLFDLPRGEHDYLKSNNISLSVNLADNQHYQLIMPNQPNSYSTAKEYAKKPTLAIAQNGKIIASESTTEKRSGLLSSISGKIGGLFNQDDALLSNQKAIAALNQPESQASTNQDTANNLDGFMQLWLNASEEEREKIRQWIRK
ncbi:DUF2057 domain-containing protein [Moraxella nasovis]|uniref:DUF2057 family protein n=1 Tax=Moraxella nasovis TaxID=2904121 RepID=UPI001F61AA87|nr:DUF2057 family protein [Moraxella nasovis]UNU73012.1 DUF2057 domain-containing protein [Moraxella nasovis]